MITQRKVPEMPNSPEKRKAIWFSLLAILTILVFGIAPYVLKSANLSEFDPLAQQYVKIGCGLAMLISVALTVRKPNAEKNSNSKSVTMHIVALNGVVFTAAFSFWLLGYRGDQIGSAVVCGCGILLILGVALPQTLRRLPL